MALPTPFTTRVWDLSTDAIRTNQYEVAYHLMAAYWHTAVPTNPPNSWYDFMAKLGVLEGCIREGLRGDPFLAARDAAGMPDAIDPSLLDRIEALVQRMREDLRLQEGGPSQEVSKSEEEATCTRAPLRSDGKGVS